MRISCRRKGRTWSIANGGIKRRADNGNVVALVGLDKAFYGLEVRKAGDSGEGPLRLLVRLIRDEFRGEWMMGYLLIPFPEELLAHVRGSYLVMIMVGVR